jgi:hypothetical protein
VQISLPLLWHPLWAGYLYTIALSEILEKDEGLMSKLIGASTFLLVTAYIAFELIYGPKLWHLLFIIAMIVIGVITGTIRFIIDIKFEGIKNKLNAIILVSFAALITISYIVLGFLFSTWTTLWILFLLIPMLVIYVEQRSGKDKFELVSYTPFIATILFFLVGYYFNLFAISWLFFLLIPITGIIEDQFKPKKSK